MTTNDLDKMHGKNVVVTFNGEKRPGVIIGHDSPALFKVSVAPFDDENIRWFGLGDLEFFEPTDSRSELDRKDDKITALKIQTAALNSEINALKDDVACKSGAIENYQDSISILKKKLMQVDKTKDEDDKPDEYDDFLIFPSNDRLCVGIDGVSVAILDAMNDKDFIGFVWGCDSDNPIVESDPFRLSVDHDGFEVCDALRFRRNNIAKDNKCIDKQDDNVDNSESAGRWVPEIGDWYFSVLVDYYGVRVDTDRYHDEYIKDNNCFKTHEQVERVADKIREVLKNG